MLFKPFITPLNAAKAVETRPGWATHVPIVTVRGLSLLVSTDLRECLIVRFLVILTGILGRPCLPLRESLCGDRS
jgi:hypothetical protein